MQKQNINQKIEKLSNYISKIKSLQQTTEDKKQIICTNSEKQTISTQFY